LVVGYWFGSYIYIYIEPNLLTNENFTLKENSFFSF